MAAKMTTAIVLCLVGAIAILTYWAARLEYKLSETRTDVNTLANMVSDLRLVIEAKE